MGPLHYLHIYVGFYVTFLLALLRYCYKVTESYYLLLFLFLRMELKLIPYEIVAVQAGQMLSYLYDPHHKKKGFSRFRTLSDTNQPAQSQKKA